MKGKPLQVEVRVVRFCGLMNERPGAIRITVHHDKAMFILLIWLILTIPNPEGGKMYSKIKNRGVTSSDKKGKKKKTLLG